MKNLGIILIVIGIIMTTVTGFNIVTEKKVLDLGKVEVKSKERTPIYWSPITGAVIAVAGVVALMASRKRI